MSVDPRIEFSPFHYPPICVLHELPSAICSVLFLIIKKKFLAELLNYPSPVSPDGSGNVIFTSAVLAELTSLESLC